MTSYSSYSSASDRRSHRTSHQPQPAFLSLPPNVHVQGPPSPLYATHFAYPQYTDINYRPRHRPPISIAIPPNYRQRRPSTGEGPRVSPIHIHPPPPPLSHSHSHSSSHSSSHSHSHPSHPSTHPNHATRGILKNGGERVSPPPQTPYVIPRPVRARGLMHFLAKRNPGAPAAPRRVRFDLREDAETWRRR